MLAAAYARFSSDNQREESITAQMRAINDYANHEGISIIAEYVDEAKSATTDDRPQFLQMIKDIETGKLKIDYLFVHKLDRFARNRYDSAIYRRKLAEANVRLIAVTQPLDDSPESLILEAMLEAMAEYYSKNLGREVMKGMTETALQAKHNGGKPPLGYDVDPLTKQYVINDQEAEAVKLIFTLALSGFGYGTIIDKLNENSYKTKLGNKFDKNSIYGILKNEKYTGTYVFNRTVSKTFGKRNNHKSKDESDIIKVYDAFPAIISREEWERLQVMMEKRIVASPRRRGNVNYLLTGKMKCGICGGAMVGSNCVSGRNNKRYYWYVCNNKKRTKDCNCKDIRKELVEDFVIGRIQKIFAGDNLFKLADRL